MALTLVTQAITSVTDTVTGLNITQSKVSTDIASVSLALNFTMEAYTLASGQSLDTQWTLINKGDMAGIREVSIFVTSALQAENIDILITTVANPNATAGTPKSFSIREMLVGATALDSAQNIWVRNPGASAATLLVILGGVNA